MHLLIIMNEAMKSKSNEFRINGVLLNRLRWAVNIARACLYLVAPANIYSSPPKRKEGWVEDVEGVKLDDPSDFTQKFHTLIFHRTGQYIDRAIHSRSTLSEEYEKK